MASTSPPDIRTSLTNWFRHFDKHNQGLSKNDVIDALTRTLAVENVENVRVMILELWPIFDTDNSGRISLQEFVAPDGLGPTINAQLPPRDADSAADSGSGNTFNRKVAEIHTMLPEFTVAQIQNALDFTMGEKDAAVEKLLTTASQSSTGRTQQQTKSVDPTRVEFHCGACSAVFAINTATLAPGTGKVRTHCPTCGRPNDVRVNLPAPSHIPGNHSHYSASNHSTSSSGVAGYRPPPGLKAIAAPPPTAPPTGSHFKKKALLIGINYHGQSAQLRGCVNDVRNLRSLLTTQYAWPADQIRILTDEPVSGFPSTYAQPTRTNIIEGLRWLAQDVKPGDALFLSFSGHGAQQADPHGVEEDGMNETILPVDFKRAGMITDDEISAILVQPLPEHARLTAVLDSCHSGTGLDLPYTWTTHTRRFVEETNPYHSLGDVQLFSGCEDDKTSSDAATFYAAAGGAMTTAFCDALRSNPCPTYTELIATIQQLLRQRGFSQRPQLSSTQTFDVHRPFILDDAVPNSNRTLGRIMRREFKARPRRISDSNFGTMLGVGGAALGGFLLADLLFG